MILCFIQQCDSSNNFNCLEWHYHLLRHITFSLASQWSFLFLFNKTKNSLLCYRETGTSSVRIFTEKKVQLKLETPSENVTISTITLQKSTKSIETILYWWCIWDLNCSWTYLSSELCFQKINQHLLSNQNHEFDSTVINIRVLLELFIARSTWLSHNRYFTKWTD